MQNTRYTPPMSMKLAFSRQIFEEGPNTKFHRNPSSGNRVVPCGQTGVRMDMANIIVAFRNFAISPKNIQLNIFASVHLLVSTRMFIHFISCMSLKHAKPSH
jgi:hypothetical protein